MRNFFGIGPHPMHTAKSQRRHTRSLRASVALCRACPSWIARRTSAAFSSLLELEAGGVTGRGCNFPWLKAGVDTPKTMHEIAQMVRIEDPFYGDSTPLLQRIRGELLGSFSTLKNSFL